MTPPPVNLAQVGCGYWGPNLLRAFAASDACRVTHVAEGSPERRDYVSRNFPGITVTSSVDAILDDASVQALVIATPAATHADLALRAIARGKHVLIEKPFACNEAEARAIAAAAEEAGLVAMAGHTFIFNDAVQYLRKLIANGDLGDVRYMFSQRLNLGRIRSDVDALWNFAPHDISILQYLLDDEPPAEFIRAGRDFVQPGIEDVVFLQLKYPSGVLGSIHVSWLDPLKVRRVTVVGSKKMAVYDDTAEDKITIYDKGIDVRAVMSEDMDYDQPRGPQFSYRSGDILIPKITYREPLRTEAAHFLDCIRNGTPCLTGPAHAINVIRILEQAGQA
ncbi:MAG TPA: Gfo/Idh/MocA family oxidoreductase [Terrimicrobiaceae bacterium]|nr:Gfo/Idh/MocA family oxidoreductase [Terrimicrobiaceae bacterium]